VNEERIIHKRI